MYLTIDGDSEFTALKAALFDGYSSVRRIDLGTFDLFLVLRAATYVGWNILRIEEDGGTARNDRFITTARRLADAYLADGQSKPMQPEFPNRAIGI